jgi:hypothetical protein
MKRLILVLTLALLPLGAFAQTPEDLCKEAGDYWSEGEAQCFVVNDMDTDESLLLKEIRSLEHEKAQLQHEQQEFDASGKTTRKNNFDAQIAKFTANRDAASDQENIDFWQAKIDQFTAKRDAMDDYDVSGHGAAISALATTISKHQEELDKLLTQ